ncbi:uncharacterized protein LOC122714089 [Apis laboriosa]|uniref:uncharacterized protein LOC122714089 n=1 Tax=Apis laboriosa TaxID=183418 RepID=UPI001CC817E1|nr:uncharacterized protein LOC122714089 [Apis laboriosa]
MFVHHNNEDPTETTLPPDMELMEVSTNNRSSLNMLENITNKIWRILPVINIPQSWVLTYCMKHTEITEDVEKATMQCQYDGTDWDCTFIELGGGRDDYNMGKIVSLFQTLSNRGLRLKMLHAAEICGKLWQKYKQFQDNRLIQMRLNIDIKNREKRSKKNSKIFENKYSKDSKITQKNLKKNLKKKIEKIHDEEIEKKRRAKKVQVIRQKLTNEITELENKKSLNPEEESKLNRLRLTMVKNPHINNLEEYPLAGDRMELSCLQEIGSCLTQQVTKACESIVLDAIKKLM